MENEVYPDILTYAEHIAGFLFYPELPLNDFTQPQTGAISEYHAYGAFLFPRYLAEHGPGPEILKASFTETAGEPDPLDVLDRLLLERGETMEATFFDFVGKNATLDYLHRQTYLEALDRSGGYLSVYSHRPSGVLSEHSEAWKTNLDHLPVSYSANYWEIRTTAEHFEVDVETQDEGRWSASLVTYDGEAHTFQTLDWTGSDTQTLAASTTANDIWLAIALLDDDAPGRVHPYRLRFRPIHESPETGDPDDTGDETPRSCGCTSGGGIVPHFALLALLVFRRRSSAQHLLDFTH